MDAEWELDRVTLFQLMREQPNWSIRRLSEAIGRCETWVKKWRKRFREAKKKGLEMFKSRSRAPKNRPKRMSEQVRNAILSYRDQLKAVYQRVVGAKTILYHLHQDPWVTGEYVPRSTRTIWCVLKDAGRIPTRVKDHHPIERPEPMKHWEMDFGQMADKVEFLSVIDRGTSILVDTQAQPHYNAETALLAVTRLFVQHGLPTRLRFDRDSRFLSSWAMDGYPSPLIRFLLCLGVVPDPTPPRRPDLKPYVERSIRTLKYECLWQNRPKNPAHAEELLEAYRYFYNHQRPHQGSACRNQPPYKAFPTLPQLPHLPDEVDPDAWLPHYHRQVFKRRLSSNGTTTIDNQSYYVGIAHAGKLVRFHLDAQQQCFYVVYQGQSIQQLGIKGLYGRRMSFSDYLNLVLDEARSIERRLAFR